MKELDVAQLKKQGIIKALTRKYHLDQRSLKQKNATRKKIQPYKNRIKQSSTKNNKCKKNAKGNVIKRNKDKV